LWAKELCDTLGFGAAVAFGSLPRNCLEMRSGGEGLSAVGYQLSARIFDSHLADSRQPIADSQQIPAKWRYTEFQFSFQEDTHARNRNQTQVESHAPTAGR
jgi:hypothetical protein